MVKYRGSVSSAAKNAALSRRRSWVRAPHAFQNGDNSNNGKTHSAKMSCRFDSCLSPNIDTLAQGKSADLPSQRLRVRAPYVSQGVHSSKLEEH